MADVLIDSASNAITARAPRTLVFTTADIGYQFFVNSGSDLVYRKTTDGGASWGAQVTVDAGTKIGFDVWYDQWTPGDTTGSLIHIAHFGSASDDLVYLNLDTSSDSLSTPVVAFAGATAVAGIGTHCSITKAVGGNLYISYQIDAGAETGARQSTTGGASWAAIATPFLGSPTGDWTQLFPAANTGDTNDVLALYFDTSANSLLLRWHDDSADTWTSSSSIVTIAENTTDMAGQYPFGASIRHSDGKLICSAVTEHDTATSDHRVFELDRTSSAFAITEKTAITTNIDDHVYPRVFIDQGTDHIYVAYRGKRDGTSVLGTDALDYYTKSTDGGTTWTAGDTAYGESAAGGQLWTPLMGPRFYASERSGANLEGNFVNSFTFSSGQTIAVNQATETDLAQAIARVKQKAVGQATETDAAQVITPANPPTVVALGQATETDAAQAVSRVKQRAVAQSVETDASQPIGKSKAKAVAQALEADLAQAIAEVKRRAVNQAAEADAAQPVGKVKTKSVAQATETDLAQQLGRVKSKATGQAVETDAAHPITLFDAGTTVVPVAQVVETDLAQPIARTKLKAVLQATETDTAQAIAEVKHVALGQALEADEAQPITVVGEEPAAEGRRGRRSTFSKFTPFAEASVAVLPVSSKGHAVRAVAATGEDGARPASVDVFAVYGFSRTPKPVNAGGGAMVAVTSVVSTGYARSVDVGWRGEAVDAAPAIATSSVMSVLARTGSTVDVSRPRVARGDVALVGARAIKNPTDEELAAMALAMLRATRRR